MIPGKKYAPEDVLAILWRRKWLLLLPTLVAMGLTYAYTRTLPNLYRSETLVMIQPPRVREDLVRSVNNPTASADRIQTITQQIMSRTRLEAIITDLNLYEAPRRTGLMEDVVEGMRRDVSVIVVRGDAFRISYVSRTPVTAMRVTERLARLFIDENLRDREMLAQGTSQFLGSQVDDARRRLVEQEKKLEAYRRSHPGELPSQQASNLTALNNIQMQVQSLVDSMARDRDRLQLIERQIADLTSPDPEEDSRRRCWQRHGGGRHHRAAADGGPQQAVAAGTSAQARASRHRAHEARHPRPREASRDRGAAGSRCRPSARKPRTPAELARRTRVKQLQAESEALLKTIAYKEAGRKAPAGKLLRPIRPAPKPRPTRETELIELMRDYSTLQDLYAGLLAKNEESKLAVNLESRQIGEQFRILDPATGPRASVQPQPAAAERDGHALRAWPSAWAVILLLEWRDTA